MSVLPVAVPSAGNWLGGRLGEVRARGVQSDSGIEEPWSLKSLKGRLEPAEDEWTPRRVVRQSARRNVVSPSDLAQPANSA
jgi:hypothetical protein